MEKKCLHCGSHFTTNRNNKKYCSTNCKQMAYFMRNGMVLAGTSTGAVKDSKPTKINLPSVKDELHSKKAESVKYESENPNVKSASAISHNENTIEALFDRLIMSIESRFNAALEKAKQEMDAKYESCIKANTIRQSEPGLCNEELMNGTEKPKVNYCAPCNTLSVKDDSEKQEVENTSIQKTDFTPSETVKDVQASVVVFPQMQPKLSLSGNTDEHSAPMQETNSTHKIKSLPLMEEDEIPSEETLEELERNEGLCNEDEYDTDENSDEDFVNDFDDEKVSDEEDTSNKDQQYIAELERQLAEYKTAKETVEFLSVKEKIKEEAEEEYKYIESRIIRKIEKHYDKIDRSYLHHDIYKGDFEVMRAASWLNVRLRSLLESLVRLTNYSQIDNHTLRCITSAFFKLAKSKSYQIVPPDKYEHKELIKDLCMKLHAMLQKNQSTQFLCFKLPLEMKAKIIAVRRELKSYTKPMKFTELDFAEETGLVQGGELIQRKSNASGWRERYEKMKRAEQRNAA